MKHLGTTEDGGIIAELSVPEAAVLCALATVIPPRKPAVQDEASPFLVELVHAPDPAAAARPAAAPRKRAPAASRKPVRVKRARPEPAAKKPEKKPARFSKGELEKILTEIIADTGHACTLDELLDGMKKHGRPYLCGHPREALRWQIKHIPRFQRVGDAFTLAPPKAGMPLARATDAERTAMRSTASASVSKPCAESGPTCRRSTNDRLSRRSRRSG